VVLASRRDRQLFRRAIFRRAAATAWHGTFRDGHGRDFEHDRGGAYRRNPFAEGEPIGEGGNALERAFPRFVDDLIWWVEAAKAQRKHRPRLLKSPTTRDQGAGIQTIANPITAIIATMTSAVTAPRYLDLSLMLVGRIEASAIGDRADVCLRPDRCEEAVTVPPERSGRFKLAARMLRRQLSLPKQLERVQEMTGASESPSAV